MALKEKKKLKDQKILDTVETYANHEPVILISEDHKNLDSKRKNRDLKDIYLYAVPKID